MFGSWAPLPIPSQATGPHSPLLTASEEPRLAALTVARLSHPDTTSSWSVFRPLCRALLQAANPGFPSGCHPGIPSRSHTGPAARWSVSKTTPGVPPTPQVGALWGDTPPAWSCHCQKGGSARSLLPVRSNSQSCRPLREGLTQPSGVE